MASATETRIGLRSRTPSAGVVTVFLGTFFASWLLLDQVIASPPTLVSATAALVASAIVLAVGQVALGIRWRLVPESLGLGRPAGRAVIVAGLVGGMYFTSLIVGAQVVGVSLDLRANWPAVLCASLIFHGLGEELVWRGFLFGHLRRSASFAGAVKRSMPFLALTHVPIIVSSGWAVGAVAVLTAIVTCLPLAYLWERGGGTVWAPALLHGLIGSWQLFERTYPVEFSMVMGAAALGVPMLVFLFRDRFFSGSSGQPGDRRNFQTDGSSDALLPQLNREQVTA